MSRQIEMQKTFQVDGDFQSKYAAEQWLSDNGYVYGSTCTPHPEVAVLKGEEYRLPQKWKNMSKEDKRAVHGVMTSYDYRNGPVSVIIYNQEVEVF